MELNEDFKSPRLAALARDNGGIKTVRNGGYREFPAAFMRGHAVDPSELTDDMIGDAFVDDGREESYIEFGNGIKFKLNPDDGTMVNGARVKRSERAYAHSGADVKDTGDHDKGGKFHNDLYDNLPKFMSTKYSSPSGWDDDARNIRYAYEFNKSQGDSEMMNKLKGSARNLMARRNMNEMTSINEADIRMMVAESLRRVMLKEENENAGDPEWIAQACRICILNNRPIYDLYEWLVKKALKLMSKGTEPSLETLTNCSTMNKIVRMAFADNDIEPRLHREEFFNVCYNTAKEVIEDAEERINAGLN